MTTAPEPHRTPWPFAMHVAERIVGELGNFCERIEIAGSVRRRRESVKDIEVLAVPRFFAVPKDMLGNPVGAAADYLTVYPEAQIKGTLSPWSFRLSKAGHPAFGPLNKLLVYKAATPQCPEIAVDVFTGTAANWGRDLWVRTGPAAWNTACAARAQSLGMRMHAYGPAAFTREGLPVTCPTEEAFARMLRLELPKPEDRTPDAARGLWLLTYLEDEDKGTWEEYPDLSQATWT